MILIIGTSLCVAPFNELPGLASDSIPLVIMNKEPIAHLEGRISNYIPGNCDKSILYLCQQLGWEVELGELHKQIGGSRIQDTRGERIYPEKKLRKCIDSIGLIDLSMTPFTNWTRPKRNVKNVRVMIPMKRIHKTRDRGKRKQKKRDRKQEKESKIIQPVVYDCIKVERG